MRSQFKDFRRRALVPIIVILVIQILIAATVTVWQDPLSATLASWGFTLNSEKHTIPFLIALWEDVFYFTTVGVLVLGLSVVLGQRAAQPKTSKELVNSITDRLSIDSTVRDYIEGQFQDLLLYGTDSSISVLVKDYDEIDGTFLIDVTHEAHITNLTDDLRYDDHLKVRMGTDYGFLPRDTEKYRICAKLLEVAIANGQEEQQLRRPISYVDGGKIERFPIRIEPRERIVFRHRYQAWVARGRPIFIQPYRFTKRTQVVVRNQLAIDDSVTLHADFDYRREGTSLPEKVLREAEPLNSSRVAEFSDMTAVSMIELHLAAADGNTARSARF